MTCIFCDRPVHTRGICGLHYKRFWKTGDFGVTPLVGRRGPPALPLTPEQRQMRPSDLGRALGITRQAASGRLQRAKKREEKK